MIQQALYRVIFVYLLTSCITLPVLSQEAKQYFFTHYTTSSGLLSNQVFSIVQDKEGYIWIAGTDGLQRFDGARYKSFRHVAGDNHSITSNQVVQLVIDKKNRLWLLFADGSTGIFNTRNFAFTPAKVIRQKAHSLQAPVKRLITDEEGNMFYLLQPYEFLTWNETSNEFSSGNNFFKTDSSWNILDVVQQPGTKKYWISIMGTGIVIYNKATGQFSTGENNIEKEPAIDSFYKKFYPSRMLFDQHNRLWFFIWRTVFPEVAIYDLTSHSTVLLNLMQQTRAYHEIHSFFQQANGKIWVMGLKVFAKFLEKEKTFQPVYNGLLNERGIDYMAIMTLFEDKEGNIWVGTENNGIYRFNPEQEYFNNILHFNRLSGKVGNGSPMSFIETKWKTFLVGTWEDGLYHYDSNFNVIPINIKGFIEKGGPFIWSMFASRDNNSIWMSAQPGIYRVDQANRVAHYYNPPVLNNSTIRQIVQDQYGNLWLGLQSRGVYIWNVGKDNNPDPKGPEKFEEIPNTPVNKLLFDRKGLIWAGTPGNGAYVIDPATRKVIMHFSNQSAGALQLPETGVSSILDYNDSLMIITTQTRVFVYNRHTGRSFLSGNSDMVSGFIAASERDDNGHVWITTTSGLYRINIDRGVFVRFNKDDGIQNDNFGLAESYHIKDGRLIFGSTNHFIVFNPTRMNSSRIMPQVVLTDLEVMNKPLSVDSLLRLKEITLGYDENSLAVSFSTLTYTSPVLVKYQLEGLDKNWKVAEKSNEAIYSYLPPGTYTLHFQTINEDGNKRISDLKLVIRINSPFWRTWWFYSMLVLLAGLLLFWIDRARMQRKEALLKMRSVIAGNLHEEVNTALNNINILSEMAKLKADTEPQKSKEFIEQIHTKSHNMIIAMDDMLWSISPDNDSMEKTLWRMQEYIDALNSRHNTRIEMLVDDKVKSLNLDMQFRHEAFILFKESIKGLALACSGSSRIHLALEKSTLVYSIQFNNEECDMQQLYNLLQRQDMSKRLDNIKAKLNVELHKSNSLLELKVPVG